MKVLLLKPIDSRLFKKFLNVYVNSKVIATFTTACTFPYTESYEPSAHTSSDSGYVGKTPLNKNKCIKYDPACIFQQNKGQKLIVNVQ